MAYWGVFYTSLPPSPLGFRSLQSNPVPEGVRDAYERGIRAMLDWEPSTDKNEVECPHILRLSDEAWSEYHAFEQANRGADATKW